MFIPATFGIALLMTILSTCCWGSFANTFKVTKNYRFELYYWDYGAGIFLISLILAFTMGSTNGGLAVALAEGAGLLQAARFGCAVAALSVTRPGTAPSMPFREEVDALLLKNK